MDGSLEVDARSCVLHAHQSFSKEVEMAPKKANDRGTVHTSWDLSMPADFTTPRDGYALPRKLTARATEDPRLPDVVVEVEIEIEEGRARATRVSVERSEGVGWTALANVPVRDIVGTAVLTALHRVEPGDQPGSFRTVMLRMLGQRLDPDEAREIVQASVGYAPNLDRFEGVAS
jgi:hypothetical protein